MIFCLCHLCVNCLVQSHGLTTRNNDLNSLKESTLINASVELIMVDVQKIPRAYYYITRVRYVVTHETSTVTVRCSVQFYFHNWTRLTCASLGPCTTVNQIGLKFGILGLMKFSINETVNNASAYASTTAWCLLDYICCMLVSSFFRLHLIRYRITTEKSRCSLECNTPGTAAATWWGHRCRETTS